MRRVGSSISDKSFQTPNRDLFPLSASVSSSVKQEEPAWWSPFWLSHLPLQCLSRWAFNQTEYQVTIRFGSRKLNCCFAPALFLPGRTFSPPFLSQLRRPLLCDTFACQIRPSLSWATRLFVQTSAVVRTLFEFYRMCASPFRLWAPRGQGPYLFIFVFHVPSPVLGT